jgi:hypothetical protein
LFHGDRTVSNDSSQSYVCASTLAGRSCVVARPFHILVVGRVRFAFHAPSAAALAEARAGDEHEPQERRGEQRRRSTPQGERRQQASGAAVAGCAGARPRAASPRAASLSSSRLRVPKSRPVRRSRREGGNANDQRTPGQQRGAAGVRAHDSMLGGLARSASCGALADNTPLGPVAICSSSFITPAVQVTNTHRTNTRRITRDGCRL